MILFLFHRQYQLTELNKNDDQERSFKKKKGIALKINCQSIYEDVEPLSCGLTQVCRNGNFGVINDKCEEIVKCQYDEVCDFENGMAAVCRDGKKGFVNTKGEEIVKCQYDKVSDFHGGVAQVCRGDKWGFVNTKGEEFVKCQYE